MNVRVLIWLVFTWDMACYFKWGGLPTS